MLTVTFNVEGELLVIFRAEDRRRRVMDVGNDGLNCASDYVGDSSGC